MKWVLRNLSRSLDGKKCKVNLWVPCNIVLPAAIWSPWGTKLVHSFFLARRMLTHATGWETRPVRMCRGAFLKVQRPSRTRVRLDHIVIYAAAEAITYRKAEDLEWSLRPTETTSIIVEDVVWPGERWDLPCLLDKNTSRMNKCLSGYAE